MFAALPENVRAVAVKNFLLWKENGESFSDMFDREMNRQMTRAFSPHGFCNHNPARWAGLL